jgi:hypothetical protein
MSKECLLGITWLVDLRLGTRLKNKRIWDLHAIVGCILNRIFCFRDEGAVTNYLPWVLDVQTLLDPTLFQTAPLASDRHQTVLHRDLQLA